MSDYCIWAVALHDLKAGDAVVIDANNHYCRKASSDDKALPSNRLKKEENSMSDFYMGEDEFGKGGCRRGGQQGAYMRHEFSSLCTALNIKGQVLIDVYAERNEFTPRDARKLAPDEVYFVTRYWEQQIRVKGGLKVRKDLLHERTAMKREEDRLDRLPPGFGQCTGVDRCYRCVDWESKGGARCKLTNTPAGGLNVCDEFRKAPAKKRPADSCRHCGHYQFHEARSSSYCKLQRVKTSIYMVCDDYIPQEGEQGE